MSSNIEDLPPDIRDQKDLIDDGLTDEFEALEEFADEQEGRAVPDGLVEEPSGEVEPEPATL